MSTLTERLATLIAHTGPLSVAQFMAHALYDPTHGYYPRQTAIGADFITAPEVSQMFGEILGAWCAHEWAAMGSPAEWALIELGPGSGTLMADIMRVLRAHPACVGLSVHLVEASPALRRRQHEQLASSKIAVTHHDRLEDVPIGPAIILGNEFLDCLPIRQFVRAENGWRERLVGVRDGALAFGLAPDALPGDTLIPEHLRNAPEGSVVEIAPGLEGVVVTIADRLRAAPGRALLIDYGPLDSEAGDTLQAVRAHQRLSPLMDPGGADLTAHVDFGALKRHALHAGLAVFGPIPQSRFLLGLGLAERERRLAATNPDRAEMLARQRDRLVGEGQMGSLFKALCLTTPALSPPAGFSQT